MKSHRTTRPFDGLTIVFVAFLVNAHAGAAQTIVEVGGGWNYRQPAPGGESYSLGINARLSLGMRVSDNVMVRLDASAIEYDREYSLAGYPPCLFGGACAQVRTVSRVTNRLAGLSLNGVLELNPKGRFYLIGGTGLDDAFGDGNARYTEMHVGGSVGAGIAVPIGERLRAVLEAQIHGMLGATAGTPWFVPITLGLRL